MRIGMIGMGAMGSRIATRLIGAGHELTVWNRTTASCEPLVAQGAAIGAEAADALQSDLALVTLFDEPAIRQTLLQTDALHRAGKRCHVAYMSTLPVNFSRELEDLHAGLRLRFIAAPMLGRPEIVDKGLLNLLVAGDPSSLDLLEAPLADAGKVWRVGDQPHQAHAVKLAANFMISGALEAMAEAAAMLKANGVDTDRFFSTMTETLFGAFVYKTYGPLISGRRPEIPSGLPLVLKDNASFLAAAADVGLRAPLAETVREALQGAYDDGLGSEDWSTALARMASLRKH